MARIYEKPSVSEAICEFRFEPSQPWDSTVLGLVYDKLKGDFPKKKQLKGFQIQFQIVRQERPERFGGGPYHMQFLRDDQRALVQLGPDILSVNHFRPYPKWSVFKSMIATAIDVYCQVAKPKGVQRMGLRYINRIEIPKHPVRIEDYVLALPSIPEHIPQVFSSWVQRVEIPFEDDDGLLVLQSGSAPEQEQEGTTFLLDLDFLTQRQETMTLESIMERVENAHNRVEFAFEDCVTDEARQLFKEVKPYA